MKFGSMFNMLFDQNAAVDKTEPADGMGVTELCWSDRHSGTIHKVHRFKTGKRKGQIKSFTYTRDKCTRSDSNGMSDDQGYNYETVPLDDDNARCATLRKDGKFYSESGNPMLLDARREYHDYSF